MADINLNTTILTIIICLVYLIIVLITYKISKSSNVNSNIYLYMIPIYNIWLAIDSVVSQKYCSGENYSESNTAQTTLIDELRLFSQNRLFKDIVIRDGNSFVIGREVSLSDFIISNQYISKKHLKIWYKNASLYITPYNTTNGTYIDGNILQPHQQYQLREGEKLIIGSEEAIYTINRKNRYA